ncbi:hypothetical protein SLEP1_g46998 [Rubroshorea leprosula]|uniref:Uncharacterized protein n=1 Tax=Rubroshorea leprosula TaxID=152421 RepID=A0AAV5LP06_9ROSI|nr:hypothetical protein SLEP1_g46998 [Rubroshorea leprosula]
MIPPNFDDGISYKAIGGVTGELLQQNTQAINQISANIAALKKSTDMFLLISISSMNEPSDFMRQMPQLPVKLNEELANIFLPPPTTFPP